MTPQPRLFWGIEQDTLFYETPRTPHWNIFSDHIAYLSLATMPILTCQVAESRNSLGFLASDYRLCILQSTTILQGKPAQCVPHSNHDSDVAPGQVSILTVVHARPLVCFFPDPGVACFHGLNPFRRGMTPRCPSLSR